LEAYFMKLSRRHQREHTSTTTSIQIHATGVEQDMDFTAADEYVGGVN
jgi:hypothetical protein